MKEEMPLLADGRRHETVTLVLTKDSYTMPCLVDSRRPAALHYNYNYNCADGAVTRSLSLAT